MALVAASMFHDISCVIVRVPSHFVSEGLSGSGKDKAPSGTSCWSYQGKDLPYAPYRSRTFNILKMFLKEKEMHIITFNRDKDVHMSHAVITKLPWIYKMAFKSERQHPAECEADRKALRIELLDWTNKVWE